MEFLTSTPVRIALGIVGTVAVSAGSYLIGKQHGVNEAVEKMQQELVANFPEIAAALNINTEETTN